MKQRILFFITLAVTVGLTFTGCSSEKNISESKDILINKSWEFVIDSAGNNSPGELNKQENLKWEQVSIPHTPKLEPMLANNQWVGDCWYRKTIQTESDWQDKKLFIRFEGAMNVATVWANGKQKITHYGGYLPFVIDITDEMIENGSVELYVKLNNEHSPVTGPKPLPQLDFNTYGGIYRDVFLLVKSKVHISDEQFANKKAGGGVFVTYPTVNNEVATVEIKTNIVNSSNRTQQITVSQRLKKGEVIIAQESVDLAINKNSDTDVKHTLKIDYPDLWSPQNPHLYHLETSITNNKTVFEKQVRRIGIRKFTFDNNELYINGERTFLRGVNRHQEYPYIGYALSNNANYRDANKIKMAGFDYVRLSHYPQTKAFMDACDELGLVTIDAILGWQYYREHEPFKKHVIQTSRDLIRRDRNYASVLAWEVSLNESWMPEEFIDSLTGAAKEEYPNEDCYTAGWQKYGYDIYLQARQHRIGHAPDYPDKPYIVSEYGDWEYYALNAGLNQDDWSDLLDEERTSRQLLESGEKRLLQQAKNIQEAHNDNFNTPAIADGYWVMYDYNRGYANDLESSGIMSIFRLPKFSYYFFQSQRNAYEKKINGVNEPMLFISNYAMPDSDKKIRVFSNCDSVELFMDDISIGTQLPDTGRIANNLNHPPFTFHSTASSYKTIRAIGYLIGNEVAEMKVTAPEKASKITLNADISGKDWQAGCKDAIFVYAKIVDKNGQTVYDADMNVEFIVEGDAQIIGKEKVKPKAGIASTLVMAGEYPGNITITAKTTDLPTGTLTLLTN